jgi:hypothetical protein
MLARLRRPILSPVTKGNALVAILLLGFPPLTRGHGAEPAPADALALVSSRRLGGSGKELASDIATHPEGGVAIVGGTTSVDFPLARAADATFNGALEPSGHPEDDAFVTHLAADGTVAFSTYLGGRGLEQATGVAVDRSGAVYVVGYTQSDDFPVTAGALQPSAGGGRDAFVAKLDATGALVFATYLGGAGFDQAEAVAIGPAGDVHVAGWTDAADFLPTRHAFGPGGETDVFVATLTADGSRLDSAVVLGGSSGDGAFDVAVSSAGEAVLVGATASTDFPVESPVQAAHGGESDAFATKIAADGTSLVFSTYLGGARSRFATGRDYASSVAVDDVGSVYVGGTAASPGFPTTSGAFRQRFPNLGRHSAVAFAAKLSARGDLVYATFVGVTAATQEPRALAVAVDREGALYLAGSVLPATPRNFPVTRTAFQKKGKGWIEAFVLKLSPDGGDVLYSTYLGGRDEDVATAVALDGGGGVFVAGTTDSKRFPGIPAAVKKDAGVSVFLAELRPTAPSS